MKFPKAKDYPKTIDIKDETYQLRMVNKIPGQTKDTFGICDDTAKIIWVRKNQSKRGLLRTTIHEFLHAVEAEYSIKLRHKRINILEIALEALLTDNF